MPSPGFPEEIWDRIFSWLAFGGGDDNAAALARLCRTSRRFRRIAEPVLYRNVRVATDLARALLLLRTLARREDLARGIRRLSCGTSSSKTAGSDSGGHGGLEGRQEQQQLLLLLLRESQGWLTLPGGFEEAVRAAVGAGEAGGAALSLLLSMASGVGVLEVSFPPEGVGISPGFGLFRGPGGCWARPSEVAGRSNWELGSPGPPPGGEVTSVTEPGGVSGAELHCFPCLREVRLRYSGASHVPSVSEIEDVLLHPGVQQLHLSVFSWCQDDVVEMKWQGCTSGVKHLEMVDCFVDAPGLLDMLTRCSRVERLSIHFHDDFWTECDVNLDAMGHILRQHARGIKSLDLLLDTSNHFAGHQDPVQGRLGSLQELHELEYLAASLSVLIGMPGGENQLGHGEPHISLVEILPDSLRKLHIYGFAGLFEANTGDEVYTMIMGGSLPRLAEVRIDEADANALEIDCPGFTKEICAGHDGQDCVILRKQSS
ncbi:hypothetical protein BX600DRAFT_457741 [Xylariales sp. PMI_506]|nr:hypothetical protein BX600DRAFT_457741 [Xylariales sp. PMI_506]